MEEKKFNIYLCLNSVHLQWQIRRYASSGGIFGSSEQEVFEGGRWGWGSPIDHSQVITGGFAPKLVKNIGAGSEEVRVRHSSSQVDGSICSSVRLSLRSSWSHDGSSSSWHPDNSKVSGMCSCVSGSHCSCSYKMFKARQNISSQDWNFSQSGTAFVASTITTLNCITVWLAAARLLCCISSP